MTGKDAVTVVSWVAATGAAVLAATIWLLAQHSAGVHPGSITTQQFEEFKTAQKEFRDAQKEIKEQLNSRLYVLEQHMLRLESGIKKLETK